MRGELTRGSLNAILAVSTIAAGAVAWVLLGPRWAIAGLFVVPVIAFFGLSIARLVTVPDTAAVTYYGRSAGQLIPRRAELPGWRTLARIWPGQFRDALASRLIVQSGALQAAHREEEALVIAGEAVAIYQDLAAERPGKYSPDLAGALDRQSRLRAAHEHLAEALTSMPVAVRLYRNLAAADPARYLPALADCLTCEATWLADIGLPGDALAAVHEATEICQDKLPWQQAPPCAPRAMLLEAELLCGQTRYREAAKLLAAGWPVAAALQQQDLLRDAAPAMRAAYRADPVHFAEVWQAETGHGPPGWLAG
jgi:hypothetical protein